MKLEKIIIPEAFLKSHPSETKLDEVLMYLEEHGKLDKPLKLNGYKLVDGYIRYIALNIMHFKETDQIKQMKRCFVWGKHWRSDNNETYVWENDEWLDINPGDLCLVDTKNGVGVIKVDNITIQRFAPRTDIKTVVGVLDIYEEDSL